MIKSKYEDIVSLPHHISKVYPKMSRVARAAQFAPFAALTGYDNKVKETSRITGKRKIVEADLKLIINKKLQIIQENIYTKPMVTITYFVPDKIKDGGEYVTVTGNIKKIDNYNKAIIFTDNTNIFINEILEIRGDIIKDNIFF